MPVSIDENGTRHGEEVDDPTFARREGDEEDGGQPFSKPADSFHASQEAIAKYGITDGRLARRATHRRGNGSGRIGHNHAQECRQRITELMHADLEY